MRWPRNSRVFTLKMVIFGRISPKFTNKSGYLGLLWTVGTQKQYQMSLDHFIQTWMALNSPKIILSKKAFRKALFATFQLLIKSRVVIIWCQGFARPLKMTWNSWIWNISCPISKIWSLWGFKVKNAKKCTFLKKIMISFVYCDKTEKKGPKWLGEFITTFDWEHFWPKIFHIWHRLLPYQWS